MAKRMRMLREWRDIVSRAARIVKQLIPEAEVYAFGSAVTGRVTGSSDIDVLVVVPNNLSERETHTYLSNKLEEHLGSTSYILDLHIVRREDLDSSPYMWWIERAARID